ncbi:Nnf1-domain-containing protein [Schizothecium vesticola]|uniref:Nnf1-domain-containing protein n=1 Tax=Schizothecium vesticola TaxID=314040 RepID=A0AA40F8U4_9PEZI|nr:Nnf1-domain-containing protein [Schizothecium vesticola]
MSATPQPTGATPPPPPPPPPHQSEPSQQPQATPQPQSEADGDGDQELESPPLPPVPVPAVVVPGPRAARLQQLFASTLHHTLDKVVRGGNFGACFPTVAARAPGTLEFVQRQMVDRLRGLCEKEFDNILQSRNVIPKLNELETLLLDAQARKESSGDGDDPPIPPHTLPAPTILAAHLAPHLTHHHAQLTAKLGATQADNAALFADIQAQRREIEALLAGVERTLADMDAASGLLGEVVGELVVETRQAAGRAAAGGGEDVEMEGGL